MQPDSWDAPGSWRRQNPGLSFEKNVNQVYDEFLATEFSLNLQWWHINLPKCANLLKCSKYWTIGGKYQRRCSRMPHRLPGPITAIHRPHTRKQVAPHACYVRYILPGKIHACDPDDVIKWKHFRVTDHLCGEFTGRRRIPRTKASDAEVGCFLWSASE